MLDLLVLGIVAILGYTWLARGFLSALMHLLCVIAAGAIAFAVWEPVAFFLLNVDNGQNELLQNVAWGAALGLPFVAALGLLRVITDKLVPANCEVDGAVNMVGGGLCGIITGIITAGMAVLSIGMCRMPTSLFGYKPVQYANDGALTVQSGLLVPADKWTAGLYKFLSAGTFRPLGGESLARLRPALAYEGALLRTNFEEGKSKVTLSPDAFSVDKRYTLVPADAGTLLRDAFDNKPQSFSTLKGESVNVAQSQIEGFVVTLKAGAKERSGNIIIGPGQMQLIVQTSETDPLSTVAVQPLAMISQAANRPDLARWRWDSPGTFFQSVGGGADANFAVEFVTPRGSKPIALSVKGVRWNVSELQPAPTYASTADRDAAIRSKAILGRSAGAIETAGAALIRVRPEALNQSFPIRVDNSLPFSIILQKDAMNGLTLNEERPPEIDGGGLVKFNTEDLKKQGFIDRNLQVRSFAASDDTRIVQVAVDGSNTQFGLLSDPASAADRSQAPMLIDSNGTTYTPVGYVFRNNEETHIYFSPQAPVASVNDLPTISRSRPDAELVLVYRITVGATITQFTIGNKAVATFVPGVRTQNN